GVWVPAAACGRPRMTSCGLANAMSSVRKMTSTQETSSMRATSSMRGPVPTPRIGAKIAARLPSATGGSRSLGAGWPAARACLAALCSDRAHQRSVRSIAFGAQLLDELEQLDQPRVRRRSPNQIDHPMHCGHLLADFARPPIRLDRLLVHANH